MSRRPSRHAKTTSRYEGRHAKPAASGAAALVGTAAKAVPASVVAGAAGSILVLSGTASAAVAAAQAGLVHGGVADLAAVKPAAPRTLVTRARHATARSAYTVVPGDTLSRISARFCGTPADYPALASASGIANPDLIFPGQAITLACHATVAPAADPAPSGDGDDAPAAGGTGSGSGSSVPGQAPAQQTQAPTASWGGSGGMSAFEACVIARESGGNPQAVNASSGAGGLFQFLPSTWAGLGYGSAYPGGAQTAPASVQEAAFGKLYAQAGTSPWAPYDGC
jgi:hypothetical protein